MANESNDDLNNLNDELKNLSKMVEDMTEYAADLVNEFDVDLSSVSGSLNDMTNVINQVNSESPYLDDIFKGDSWKSVLKATVPGVNLDSTEPSPGGEQFQPVWFEDYDKNNDGVLDILDVTSWTDSGRADIAEHLSKVISGEIPEPEHKPKQEDSTPDPEVTLEFFEDYDVNGDGVINVLDATIWVNQGRPEVAEKISKFILGEEPMPPKRASEDPVWFEDYDLNSDGNLDVLDAQAWMVKGRADISQKIIDIALGNEEMPTKKSEVGDEE